MTRAPHWMGERDYARDLALEERERVLQEWEDADLRREAAPYDWPVPAAAEGEF